MVWNNFLIILIASLIHGHASVVRSLMVTPKIPTLPTIQLPELLHKRFPRLPRLTLPSPSHSALLPPSLPMNNGLPKIGITDKVTHFPPSTNALSLKPISDDKAMQVSENSLNTVDSKMIAPVNGMAEVSMVEPVSFSTPTPLNESGKMISDESLSQNISNINSLSDKSEVTVTSAPPPLNPLNIESSSLNNNSINVSPNFSNSDSNASNPDSSVSNIDSGISMLESGISNSVPSISNPVLQSKENDKKDILSASIPPSKPPIPRFSLKAPSVKLQEKQKADPKIPLLNKQLPSLATIPKDPIKLESTESIISNSPSSSGVKSESEDPAQNLSLGTLKNTLSESSVQSNVNSANNFEKSLPNNEIFSSGSSNLAGTLSSGSASGSSNSESNLEPLNLAPPSSSSDFASNLGSWNPASPSGSSSSAKHFGPLNSILPSGSSNSAKNLWSFSGSSNSAPSLRPMQSIPHLPSAVLLNLPNNPIHAIPGIDTPGGVLNNSKRAIQNQPPQTAISEPQNLLSLGYQTAGASQNYQQLSSVSNQNVQQQYIANPPNNFQTFPDNSLTGANPQIYPQMYSYPQLNLTQNSQLDLTSKLGLPELQLQGINQPLVSIPNNGSLVVSLPIPQGAAPAVTSLLSQSDSSQLILPQILTSNQNEVPERIPCTCGVFLSGQFKRGSHAQPKGNAVIQNELSQSFPCNSAGKNQCTNKCLDVMVKHLPNSASIICGTVDRDIRREKAYLWVKNCKDSWANTNLSSGKEHCCKDGESVKCNGI